MDKLTTAIVHYFNDNPKFYKAACAIGSFFLFLSNLFFAGSIISLVTDFFGMIELDYYMPIGFILAHFTLIVLVTHKFGMWFSYRSSKLN